MKDLNGNYIEGLVSNPFVGDIVKEFNIKSHKLIRLKKYSKENLSSSRRIFSKDLEDIMKRLLQEHL